MEPLIQHQQSIYGRKAALWWSAAVFKLGTEQKLFHTSVVYSGGNDGELHVAVECTTFRYDVVDTPGFVATSMHGLCVSRLCAYLQL